MRAALTFTIFLFISTCSSNVDPVKQTETAISGTQVALENTRTALSLGATQTALAQEGEALQVVVAGTQTHEALFDRGIRDNSDWTPRIETFDGVQMAYVPAGCFMMGSSDAEIDYAVSLGAEREWLDNETPQHQVCLDAFWIDVYEVTNAQFAQFNGQAANASYSTEANRPREQITWFEASDFCAARDAQLPSEAEWEYAARGPEGLIFPWGNTFVAENVVSGDNQTADVGSRPGGISWVGAYDLSGNVWELTRTVYAADGYYSNMNDNSNRVLRGGSWGNLGVGLRAADRGGSNPGVRFDDNGFRCVRSTNSSDN